MRASMWGLTVLLALLLTGASDLVGHTEAAGKPRKAQVKKPTKQTTNTTTTTTKKKHHHKKHRHHKKHHHKKKTGSSSSKGLLQNLETELAMAEKDLKALLGK